MIEIYENAFGCWVAVLDICDYSFTDFKVKKRIDVDINKTFVIFKTKEDALNAVSKYLEERSFKHKVKVR